jgi:hypothetical protein
MTQTLLEPSRETPVAAACDVLVCGGGPAGVAAALAAARLGSDTRLIEAQGCLGGVWTSGLLSYILDSGNKAGLIQEIKGRHETYWGTPVVYDESHDLPWVTGSFYYDPEVMKLVLEDLCAEAGVKVQLHTRVSAAYREGDRQITTVVTESKSGRQAWQAKINIDATGDGDLSALAGCRFDLGRTVPGRPDFGATQPMTLLGLVTGLRAEEVQPFLTGTKGEAGQASRNLLAEMQHAGLAPSYSRPLLAHIHAGLYVLMANHAYGFSGLDAAQLTRATFQARQELHRQVQALRLLGGPWQGLRLVATAAQIGVREGRRIRGLYQVGVDDLVEGRRHPDAVCTVTFPVDVHSTDRQQGTGYSAENVRSKPYDLPLRALIAADADNLLMAGRCISGDFLAHASYRVTGNAVPMGEAAGVTATLAASVGCRPDQVPFPDVQARLAALQTLHH